MYNNEIISLLINGYDWQSTAVELSNRHQLPLPDARQLVQEVLTERFKMDNDELKPMVKSQILTLHWELYRLAMQDGNLQLAVNILGKINDLSQLDSVRSTGHFTVTIQNLEK
jgi:hypothetical protein